MTKIEATKRIKAQASERGRPIRRITWHYFNPLTTASGRRAKVGALTIESDGHNPLRLAFQWTESEGWRLF